MILLLIALINLLVVSFGNDGFIKDGQAYMTAVFIECLFEIPIGCCIGCFLDNRH
ncbi:MAG: hypothetical protein IIY81_11045 [Lachnospiraceae bacterium]|nr:hypothetical protein [Lachnospiraceae bacterium]